MRFTRKTWLTFAVVLALFALTAAPVMAGSGENQSHNSERVHNECPPSAGDAVVWPAGDAPDKNGDGLVCVIPKGPAELEVARIIDNKVPDMSEAGNS